MRNEVLPLLCWLRKDSFFALLLTAGSAGFFVPIRLRIARYEAGKKLESTN
jgi:hypothetical protein